MTETPISPPAFRHCVTRFSAVRHRLDPDFPTRTLCRQRVAYLVPDKSLRQWTDCLACEREMERRRTT